MPPVVTTLPETDVAAVELWAAVDIAAVTEDGGAVLTASVIAADWLGAAADAAWEMAADWEGAAATAACAIEAA